jgi:hypothetical protein
VKVDSQRKERHIIIIHQVAKYGGADQLDAPSPERTAAARREARY